MARYTRTRTREGQGQDTGTRMDKAGGYFGKANKIVKCKSMYALQSLKL